MMKTAKTALATIFAMTLATSALAADSGASTDAVERYKGIFTQLDADSSQSLNAEEAAAAGLSGESLTRLDTNGDGSLSLEEFLVLASEPEGTTGSGTTDGATDSETDTDTRQDVQPQ